MSEESPGSVADAPRHGDRTGINTRASNGPRQISGCLRSLLPVLGVFSEPLDGGRLRRSHRDAKCGPPVLAVAITLQIVKRSEALQPSVIVNSEIDVIIWGSYVIRKELKTGQFYCPHCASDRPFVHKLPRRWGHLYWIPLIIMDTHESYVECQTCGKTYQEQVLDYDPRREHAQKLASLATMIGQIMIHTAHADGRQITMPEIEKFVTGLLNIERLPPEAETRILTPIDRDKMLTLVRENGDGLVARGQEIVLRTSLGPGLLEPQAQALIVEIGVAMGMTPTHVKGVLAETLAQSAALSDQQASWPDSRGVAR